ncbi:MAG: hypothetical protein A3D35_01755 [Candidatus Staskawiczbacteria bacterium RIFCSPHIGHO2_02_FULL_34_9]|uniref:Uncharacterized protein n=1 Tax=Candidatus Staskawiczbacteria bacterium RIFCSPHIGHO2_02_FULL_34_9 TaxID=1802206 RepID=A0A1G2I430_9BACT|nr:MAG: hypothetical protein A3D35_01755 [Candidatus Staskawiczbacteria bacterium RIFCSPHIGHO2_02_FULL_34_9]
MKTQSDLTVQKKCVRIMSRWQWYTFMTLLAVTFGLGTYFLMLHAKDPRLRVWPWPLLFSLQFCSPFLIMAFLFRGIAKRNGSDGMPIR